MFLVGALAFLPVILISGAQEEGPTTQEQERRPASELTQDHGLMGILIATFLMGIALGLGLAYEGIYMDSLGGSQALIGLLGGFQAISELPTMRYGTAIARRLKGPRTLLIGYGFIGVSFLTYTFVQTPVLLLLLSTLKGIGFGLLYTNTIRTINERAPAEWSATAQSLMTVGLFGLAPLIASPLGGIVLDAFGPRAIFIGATFATGMGAVVLLISAARYKLP
jgi:PPP family 3-phenylpropionic acid transporter